MYSVGRKTGSGEEAGSDESGLTWLDFCLVTVG